MGEIVKNNSVSEDERSEIASKDVKKETNIISVPFLPISFANRNKKNTGKMINLTLKSAFGKSLELFGYKNSKSSTKEILSQRIFAGKTMYEVIFSDIELELNSDFKNIKSIGVDSGYLKVYLEDGDYLEYNLSAKSVEGLIVKKQTKEAIHKLDESLDKKDIIKKVAFAGTIIALTYEPVIVATAETVDKKLGKLKRLKFKSYGKEIEVEVPNGEVVKMNELDFRINNNLEFIKLLDKVGYEFDAEVGEFRAKTRNIEFNRAVSAVKYEDLKKSVKKYSYEDYLENMANSEDLKEKIITKKEFKDLKKQGLLELDAINNEFNVNKKGSFGEFLKTKGISRFFEKGLGKALHFIMFPVFFKELHKHSGNLDALLKSSVEYFAFTQGAKLGSKVWGPRWIKMITGLIVGMAGVFVGTKGIHAFDKELTKALPNSEDFWQRLFKLEKQGFGVKLVDTAGHLISLGFINDLADLINTDIGLHGTKIDLFKNNIDFGTKIEDYLRERISGVNHWNKEVEEFKIKTINDLKTEIFDKDFRYSDIVPKKDELEIGVFSDTFEEKIQKLLEALGKFDSNFIVNDAKHHSLSIRMFIQDNLPRDLLIGELKDIDYPEKGKKIDEFYKKLKQFIKDKKILKDEKLESFIYGMDQIFNSKMDEKINDILGNPDMIESVLGNSGEIHNTTKDIKTFLAGYVKKAYYKSKKGKIKIELSKKGTKNLTEYEAIIANEIDKLKIDKEYISNYKENVASDKKLIDLALEGKLDSVTQIGAITLLPVIEDGKEKVYSTTGDVSDLLYISKLPKKDRNYWKNIILYGIEHPEKGMMNVGGISDDMNSNGFVEAVDNHKTMTINQTIGNKKLLDYKRLIDEGKGKIFYNRLIDYKRRKVFIENIEKHGDATSTEVGNDVIEVLHNTDIINAVLYFSKKYADIVRKNIKN